MAYHYIQHVTKHPHKHPYILCHTYFHYAYPVPSTSALKKMLKSTITADPDANPSPVQLGVQVPNVSTSQVITRRATGNDGVT